MKAKELLAAGYVKDFVSVIKKCWIFTFISLITGGSVTRSWNNVPLLMDLY